MIFLTVRQNFSTWTDGCISQLSFKFRTKHSFGFAVINSTTHIYIYISTFHLQMHIERVRFSYARLLFPDVLRVFRVYIQLKIDCKQSSSISSFHICLLNCRYFFVASIILLRSSLYFCFVFFFFSVQILDLFVCGVKICHKEREKNVIWNV